MARKKRTKGTREPHPPEAPREASVHVHVSGDSLDDVGEKIARLHARGSKRKGKRTAKRGSHRE